MGTKQIQNPNDRYLSLTGVILEDEYYRKVFHPKLFEFKAHLIPGYPDNPPGKAYCLHRKDILKRQKGFEFLNDGRIRNEFDRGLIDIVESSNYTVISVVIDKFAHYQTYGEIVRNPYFYCLRIIVERYVRFLEDNRSRGDVMIEARDKDKDRALKGAFREIFIHGTSYIPPKRFQSVLTSKEIKIKPKEANIYGLQLADIVAYPSYAGIRNQHLKQEVPDNFGGLIFEIMNDEKYYRVSNRIWGLGKNWLP